MNWFKKKKEPELIAPVFEPQPCKHKWRDFDWYIEYYWESEYGGNHRTLIIKIIEPYVCCWCKERKNHVLQQTIFRNLSPKNLNEAIADVTKDYKTRIKERAIVEDEIADMQMSIDREYLEIVAKCFPEKLGLSEEQYKKLKEG